MCNDNMIEKLWIWPLILLLSFQFIFIFMARDVYGSKLISCYTSLDLRELNPNFPDKIEGKSVLSFMYLINETFQLTLFVETYDPNMPEVLIQFYPDNGEDGYTRGDFSRVPLSELDTDRTAAGFLELDISDYISYFYGISETEFKAVSKIGIRGIDCYIGDIWLKDPDTFNYYPDPNTGKLLIDSDPNMDIFEQGWASNNSYDSFVT
ncbi:MAG: hypothetical protein ACMUHX_10435, partial [bacterium]